MKNFESNVFNNIFKEPDSQRSKLSLEEDIVKNGCRDALVVWKEKNILLDGHKRYEICTRHNIPFKVIELSFASNIEAEKWIFSNQLMRRNLTTWQKSNIVLEQFEDYYADLAKNNQRLSKGRGKKGSKVSANHKTINANEELAKIAEVSSDTVKKVKKLRKKHESCDEEEREFMERLIRELDENKIHVNTAYNRMQDTFKKIRKNNNSKISHNYTNDLDKDVVNNVLCMDIFKGLRLIKDGTISLCFTSPPFNCGIKYNGSPEDNMPWDEYVDWTYQYLKEIKAKLRKGGRLAIEIEQTSIRDDENKLTGAKHFIDFEIYNIAKKLGYLYRNEIIWYKRTEGKNRPPSGLSFPDNPIIRNTHSRIIVLSKDSYELQRCTDHLSAINEDEYKVLTNSVWNIFPETHGEGSHPCPMPVQLAENVIKLYSYEGDTVLDPFGGSGTTAIAAIRNNRNYIHIDMSETYCYETKKRIAKEFNSLKTAIKKAA